ncbi:hypothetical protein IT413_06170 [Candidatus Peregrinibacteria bacterium]|nr:hypothetical protein [Candidatus Peregrinibacteria bacterium]
MKKQNVVATLGTLALVANLLVPGMAFGQADQEVQDASQTINCPGTRTFNFADFPDDVTFDSLTALPTAQDSYDTQLNDDEPLDSLNVLGVEDTRSGGVDGCPTTEPGFEVQATISTTLTNGVDTIDDSNFRVITSNEFDVNPGSCTTAAGEEVCYTAATGTGNLHNVNAAELYDDEARAVGTVFDKFNTKEAYTELVEAGATESDPSSGNNLRTTNTLDNNVVLMRSVSSHNQTMYTGVAIYGNIPGNQAPGLYTGVIQYTLNGVTP